MHAADHLFYTLVYIHLIYAVMIITIKLHVVFSIFFHQRKEEADQ